MKTGVLAAAIAARTRIDLQSGPALGKRAEVRLCAAAARDIAGAAQFAKDGACAPFVAYVDLIGARVNLGRLIEDRPPDALIDNAAVFQVEGNKEARKYQETDYDSGKRDTDSPAMPQGAKQHQGALPKTHESALDLFFGTEVSWHFVDVQPEE
jgi:hypothetical protein